MEGGRHAGYEVIATPVGDQVEGQVWVEVLQLDQEQFAFLGAAGVHALDAVIEGVPVDEAVGEGEVGVGGLVRLKDPAPVGGGAWRTYWKASST